MAGVGRYPVELEAAVFFLWRAVLDGLGAHAQAVIRVREESEALRVEITTDREVDLSAVRDLLEAAGGDQPEPRDGRLCMRFPLT